MMTEYKCWRWISTVMVIAVCVALPLGEASAQSVSGEIVMAMAWSPDGTRIATGDRNGIVRIWDALTGALEHTLTEHQDRVSDLAWHPNEDKLLSASFDGSALLWDVNSEQLLKRFVHKGLVTTLTWRRDGKRILSAAGSAEGQNLYIWDTDTGQLIKTYSRGDILRMVWSPDGSKLAIVIAFGSVDFADPVTFDMLIGNLLHPEAGDFGQHFDTYAMAWSPDSRQIATGSLNGVVRLWDVASRKIVLEMRGNDATRVNIEASAISTVAFSADGSRLFSMSNDGTLREFLVSTGQILATMKVKNPLVAYDVAWSAYGARLAFGGTLVPSENILSLRDFGNGTLQVVAPFVSIEELQSIVNRCVTQSGPKQTLATRLTNRQLPEFISGVQSLSKDQIPPACANDLERNPSRLISLRSRRVV